MEWSKRRSDSQNDGKSKINANFCVFYDRDTCTVHTYRQHYWQHGE